MVNIDSELDSIAERPRMPVGINLIWSIERAPDLVLDSIKRIKQVNLEHPLLSTP